MKQSIDISDDNLPIIEILCVSLIYVVYFFNVEFFETFLMLKI